MTAREDLGRLVRETWIAWAREQTDPKPSWLTGWDELDDGQREVDRRIGAAVAAQATAAERERLAAVMPPDRFRLLADWFDADDEFKAAQFPTLDRDQTPEVQGDLRRFADLLDGAT